MSFWSNLLKLLFRIDKTPHPKPIPSPTVQIPLSGFVKHSTDTSTRPTHTNAQIRQFVGKQGPFRFPSPYNTQAIRITSELDDVPASLEPIGYSYWRNINNHINDPFFLVFVSYNRNKGGLGPTIFRVEKDSRKVTNLGPIFPETSNLSWATGEGWHFSSREPYDLIFNEGSSLKAINVLTKAQRGIFNVSPSSLLWQINSSSDGKTHSATLRDSTTYRNRGCIAFTTEKSLYFRDVIEFDECQIDRSGRYLLIKEDIDHVDGEDNLIVDLETGATQALLDKQGAAGHSDMGFGYMVAEDNYYHLPNALRLWNLAGPFPESIDQGKLIYHGVEWGGGVGHISHTNAAPGPASNQFICVSNASRVNYPRSNEIIQIRLDGSLNCRIIAPNLVNLDASGGGDDYRKYPKGNLDITGKYFVWSANCDSDHLDVFVVEL